MFILTSHVLRKPDWCLCWRFCAALSCTFVTILFKNVHETCICGDGVVSDETRVSRYKKELKPQFFSFLSVKNEFANNIAFEINFSDKI